MLLKVKQAIKRNIVDKVKIDRLKEKKEKGQKERKEKSPYRKKETIMLSDPTIFLLKFSNFYRRFTATFCKCKNIL